MLARKGVLEQRVTVSVKVSTECDDRVTVRIARGARLLSIVDFLWLIRVVGREYWL